jgi:hypothetical protein
LQPIFLKELIPYRDLLELKQNVNPFGEADVEDTKEEDLAGFEEDSRRGRYPVSPASNQKGIRRDIKKSQKEGY